MEFLGIIVELSAVAAIGGGGAVCGFSDIGGIVDAVVGAAVDDGCSAFVILSASAGAAVEATENQKIICSKLIIKC